MHSPALPQNAIAHLKKSMAYEVCLPNYQATIRRSLTQNMQQTAGACCKSAEEYSDAASQILGADIISLSAAMCISACSPATTMSSQWRCEYELSGQQALILDNLSWHEASICMPSCALVAANCT